MFFLLHSIVAIDPLQWCLLQVFYASNFHRTYIILMLFLVFQCADEFEHEKRECCHSKFFPSNQGPIKAMEGEGLLSIDRIFCE